MDDKAHELIGNHIYFSENLKNLFYHNMFTINIINSAFILGTVAYVIYFIKRYSDAQIKAALVYLTLVINIIVFGLINETRMYFILFPFIIFIEIRL